MPDQNSVLPNETGKAGLSFEQFLNFPSNPGIRLETAKPQPKSYPDNPEFQPIFWTLDHHPHEHPEGQHETKKEYAMTTAAIIGVIANIFVLIVCWKSTNLGQRHATVLVISLTVSDLFVCGGVMLPTPHMRHAVKGHHENSKSLATICMAWYFFTTLTCAASSFNICAIALDRYRYITRPLRYYSTVTWRVVFRISFTVWTLSAMVAAATVFLPGLQHVDTHKPTPTPTPKEYDSSTQQPDDEGGETEQMYVCRHEPDNIKSLAVVFVVLFLPAAIVIFLYARIFFVARSARRRGSASGSNNYDNSKNLASAKLAFNELDNKHRARLADKEQNQKHSERLADNEQNQYSFLSGDHGVPFESSCDTPLRVPYSIPLRYQESSQTFIPGDHIVTFESACEIQQWDPSNAVQQHQEYSQADSQFMLTQPESSFSANLLKSTSVESSAFAEMEEPKQQEPRRSFGARARLGKSIVAYAADVGTAAYSMYVPLQEMKAIIVLCVIVGTYIMCWMPFAVFITLEVVLDRKFGNSYREVLLWLGYSNSCWNPIIYAGLNTLFRSAVVRQFMRIKCSALLWTNLQPTSCHYK